MKKLNKIFITLTIIIINMFFCFNAYGAAKQNYVATLTGDSTVKKNHEFTLAFNATSLGSLSNGFAGYSGKIEFDNTKLQFVKATNVVNGWVINTAKNSETKITFLGYDDMTPANTVYSDSKICNITFKVLPSASGSTTININTIKGTTSAGESLVAADISKTVTITDDEPTPNPKSSDATLKGLSVSSGSLSPAFNPSTESYKVSVGNDVTKIDVSALTNDPNAKVSISGNNNLSVGKNNIIVQVTAEDGSKKTYTIEVTRAGKTSTYTPTTKSSNANLKSINGIDGLNFDPNKTSYDVEVSFETTNISVTAVPESPKATTSISNGKLSDLKVGETKTVTIAVKAEDGTIKVYTINVKRSQYKSETDLDKLSVDDKDLTPGANGEYNITVSSDKKSVLVSAIPKSKDATVKIIGNKNLKSGNNKVVVQVTDKNGFTKSYIVNVQRQQELSFFRFVDKYWYLFLLLPFLIMLILLYYYHKNKKYLAALNDQEEEIHERLTENYAPTNIDNKVYISYNSNNSIGYVDNDARDSLQTNVDRLLNDSSIPEVERTVSYVKEGVDDIEREYEIKEKLRKK